MIGISPQDETDTAPAQTGGDIGQTIHEKAVVAAVCALDERIQPEERHDRESQLVAEPYGDVERRVVHGSLCALHPVDDAASVRVGLALGANRDARVATQCQT